MLTINADTYPLMSLFHKPDEEKRMVVILHDDHYGEWLNAGRDESRDFLMPYPAERLQAVNVQHKAAIKK